MGEVWGRCWGGGQPLEQATRGDPLPPLPLRAALPPLERDGQPGHGRQQLGGDRRHHPRQHDQLWCSCQWQKRSGAIEQNITLYLTTTLQVKAAMLKKHRHQFEGMKKQHPENGIGSDMSKLPLIRSLADIGKTHSSAKSKDCWKLLVYWAMIFQKKILFWRWSNSK